MCCCSAWFADAVFDKLGLPTHWLHHLYQAVLAPVRLLWLAMPRETYARHYKTFVQDSDLHDRPTLANLARGFQGGVQLAV